VDAVVIEAGVVTGYVIAWAVRKVRRAGGRLDSEANAVIDASLDRLHQVVAAKLAGHSVLAELAEEAVAGGEVSELIRQQMGLALTEAARKDVAFAQVATELVAHLRQAEQLAGQRVITAAGSTVIAGNAHSRADRGGIAVGQVAGDMHVYRDPMDPPVPGRPGH
jgi:hypothetical protein